MYDNAKAKGATAEIQVISYLVKHGYTISLPFGENAPYDLIAESPTGKVYRVQVRWSTWKNNRLALSLRAISLNYVRTIDRSRIETFVAWDGERPYFIPTEHTMSCKSLFSMRRGKTKNNQSARIRMAADYMEALEFLP